MNARNAERSASQFLPVQEDTKHNDVESERGERIIIALEAPQNHAENARKNHRDNYADECRHKKVPVMLRH